jgi:O-methyltransferase
MVLQRMDIIFMRLNKMKKILKKILGIRNLQEDYFSWVNDSLFNQISQEMIEGKHTTLLKDRLFPLWQFAKQGSRFEGSFAQVGVFKGGSARLIAEAKKENKQPFYLFDTFEGMPKVNEKIDLHKEGDFKNTSLENVKKLFTGIENIVFCPGFFPKTSSPAQNDKFAFVYIDVDIYQSVKDSLEFFYPRMLQGGFMIFDDYMGKNTPGVKKAMDEFLRDKKEIPIITAKAQCVLIKQ